MATIATEPVPSSADDARSPSPLTPALLERCRKRAAGYDRDNKFFSEDFEELRDAGYLRLPLPAEFGGPGLGLADVVREQRRLAYYAPPTALGINMHLYWFGVAADLWRAGDRSMEWLLNEAARGAVFAAGHAESGNVAVSSTLMPAKNRHSTTRAWRGSRVASRCSASSNARRSSLWLPVAAPRSGSSVIRTTSPPRFWALFAAA